MSKIMVRDADPGDTPAVVSLTRESAQEDGKMSPITESCVGALFQTTAGGVLLLEADGRYIGLLSNTLRPNLESHRSGLPIRTAIRSPRRTRPRNESSAGGFRPGLGRSARLRGKIRFDPSRQHRRDPLPPPARADGRGTLLGKASPASPSRNHLKGKHPGITAILSASAALAAACLIAGCGMDLSAFSTPTAGVPRTLQETYWKDFNITDFDAVHSPIPGDDEGHLIFGGIPISAPAEDLAPELAALLGRWEGYDYAPPVKKDNKGVLVIREISPTGGKAYMWAGTNLQYPYWIKEIGFHVNSSGGYPIIEWQADLTGAPGGAGMTAPIRLGYDPETQELRGGVNVPSSGVLFGTWRLTRAETFPVFPDYTRYLAGKGIEIRPYRSTSLTNFGAGYMIYLPEGYAEDPGKDWPLMVFLHGSGDRGENILLIAKASPFMMIREQGPLPFIIAAPLLKQSTRLASFPESYLEGVVDEILSEYRVDRSRIYLTGLSMGGEAAYRFALHRPDLIAAISPLAGFDPKFSSAALNAGFSTLPLPLENLQGIPVWAISGADDTVVPLSVVRQTVDEFLAAGVDIRLTILEGHDHDVWTDTYSDPEYYEWFLQFRKS
jgi:dienelactone hydrolase